MTLINIPEKAETVIVENEHATVIKFGFPTAEATFERIDNNLVLSFENNSQVNIEGFFDTTDGAKLPDLILEDDTKIEAADFLQALDPNFDISTAAGPDSNSSSNSSGIGAYDDDSGSLIAGVDRLLAEDSIYWDRAATPTFEVYSSSRDSAGLEDSLDSNNDHETTPDLPAHAHIVITNGLSNSSFKFYAQDSMGNLIKDDQALLESIEYTQESNDYFNVTFDVSTGQFIVTLSDLGKTALASGEKIGDVLTINVGGNEYKVDIFGSSSDSYDYNDREEETSNSFGKPLLGEWYNSDGKLIADASITLGGTSHNEVNILNINNAGNTTALQDSVIAIDGGKTSIINISAGSEVGGDITGILTNAGQESSILGGNGHSEIYVSASGSGSAYGVNASGDTTIQGTDVSIKANGDSTSYGVLSDAASTTINATDSIHISAGSTSSAGSFGVLSKNGGSTKINGSENGSSDITVAVVGDKYAGTETSSSALSGDSSINIQNDNNSVNVSAISTGANVNASGLSNGASVNLENGNNNEINILAETSKTGSGAAYGTSYGLSSGSSVNLSDSSDNQLKVVANGVTSSRATAIDSSSINTTGDRNQIEVSANASSWAYGVNKGEINVAGNQNEIAVSTKSTGSSATGLVGSQLNIDGDENKLNINSTAQSSQASSLEKSTINIQGSNNTANIITTTSGQVYAVNDFSTIKLGETGGSDTGNELNIISTSRGSVAHSLYDSTVNINSSNSKVNIESTSNSQAFGAFRSKINSYEDNNEISVKVNTNGQYADANGLAYSGISASGNDAIVTISAVGKGTATALLGSSLNLSGGNSTVDVLAKSSGSSTRALAVANGSAIAINNDNNVLNITADGAIATGISGSALTIKGNSNTAIVDVTATGTANGLVSNSNALLIDGNKNSFSATVAGSTATGLSSATATIKGQENTFDLTAKGTLNAYALDGSNINHKGSGSVNLTSTSVDGSAVGLTKGSSVTLESGSLNIASSSTNGLAYGLAAYTDGVKNAVTSGGNVKITAESEHGSASAMYSGADSTSAGVTGGVNSIHANNVELMASGGDARVMSVNSANGHNEVVSQNANAAFTVSLTASAGSFDKAIALWASQGNNVIDGSNSTGANITINGGITAVNSGHNTIHGSLTGDNTYRINGAITSDSDSPALTIIGGKGEDTLILSAGSYREFVDRYDSWLLTCNEQNTLVNINTVSVDAGEFSSTTYNSNFSDFNDYLTGLMPEGTSVEYIIDGKSMTYDQAVEHYATQAEAFTAHSAMMGLDDISHLVATSEHNYGQAGDLQEGSTSAHDINSSEYLASGDVPSSIYTQSPTGHITDAQIASVYQDDYATDNYSGMYDVLTENSIFLDQGNSFVETPFIGYDSNSTDEIIFGNTNAESYIWAEDVIGGINTINNADFDLALDHSVNTPISGTDLVNDSINLESMSDYGSIDDLFTNPLESGVSVLDDSTLATTLDISSDSQVVNTTMDTASYDTAQSSENEALAILQVALQNTN